MFQAHVRARCASRPSLHGVIGRSDRAGSTVASTLKAHDTRGPAPHSSSSASSSSCSLPLRLNSRIRLKGNLSQCCFTSSAGVSLRRKYLILRRPAPPTQAMSATHIQSRGHAGRSHNHDNTYLTSTNKNDAGVRITRIGLLVNLGMVVGKGIGGYVFHSQGTHKDKMERYSPFSIVIASILLQRLQLSC